MKKVAFVEALVGKKYVVVRVGGNELVKFNSISDACYWAFSIGYRVYVKDSVKSDKTSWVKYNPVNGV